MEAYQSFNQMADNIKALRIEGYEKEIVRYYDELREITAQAESLF